MKRRFCFPLLSATVLGLASLFSPVTASAVVVTLDFTGTVNVVPSLLTNSLITIGDAVSGSISYDTDTVDAAPGVPGYGQYFNAVTGLSGSVGGFTLAFNATRSTESKVFFQDPDLGDEISLIGGLSGTLPTTAGQTATARSLEILLRGPGCTSSDGLPTTFPSLGCATDAKFGRVNFGIPSGDGTASPDAMFSLLTLTQRDAPGGGQVPEPQTLALVSAALLAGSVVRRMRTKH